MREVAIIGAGELGGTIAHALARQHAADVVRLVDDNGRVAEGKALDITQAAPLERFSTTVAGSTDLTRAAGAEIVVIADLAGGGEWQGEDGLTLVRRLNALAAGALFVCAGVSHRELVERAVRELHIARARIFGSAPEALVAAAAAVVALEVDASPRDLALAILGVPPSQLVIAWEDAAISGFALTRVIAEPVRRRLAERIGALWPVGPYALASAACKVVEAASGRSRRLVTCFVAPDDSAGVRARASAMPVRLGPAGAVKVVLPALSVVERVALDNAMML